MSSGAFSKPHSKTSRETIISNLIIGVDCVPVLCVSDYGVKKKREMIFQPINRQWSHQEKRIEGYRLDVTQTVTYVTTPIGTYMNDMHMVCTFLLFAL